MAALMALTFCFGCTNDTSNDVKTELQDGVITYENAVSESILGEENSGTVATATASNGATVSYSLSEDSSTKLATAFGGALTIASDGTIQGKYDKVKKFKVDVTASAEKCEIGRAHV